MLESNRSAIQKWYKANHRKLPWRETNDPYFIWLSEIILQQTRVQQGLAYYNRFIKAFPTIEQFAQAQETDILHLWQGLGYYSRARNMHFTAKYIVEHFNGQFPSKYEDIIKLKGVGEYTAAAIASFAFDLPYPAVDGNVMRVISRLYGIEDDIKLGATKKTITAICQEMMDKTKPALFNQSMMEFGALQCKASNPECSSCPLQESCYAYLNNKVQELPLRINKTKIRNRYFNYLIIKSTSNIYIQQRRGKGIWQNLYEYPLFEHNSIISQTDLLKDLRQFCKGGVHLKYRSEVIKHKLSHQLLHIQFNVIECENLKPEKPWKLIPINSIDDYPFPEIINKYKEFLL